MYFAGSARARGGGLRRYRDIDWALVSRLVFVCTGNICRSPYCSVKADSIGLRSASCGIAADSSSCADERAVVNASARGVDLSHHRSAPSTRRFLCSGDLILGLEPRHARFVERLAGGSGAQVSLLGLWCSTPVVYIPDPYGRSDDCFQFVFSLIDDALSSIQSLARAART